MKKKPMKKKPQSIPLFLRSIQEVGPAVERLRKQKGWTQTELAKKIGVRQGTISDLEKKDKIPTLKTLFAILAVFDYEIKISQRVHSDDPYNGLF